jgi:hypothetical protein
LFILLSIYEKENPFPQPIADFVDRWLSCLEILPDASKSP